MLRRTLEPIRRNWVNFQPASTRDYADLLLTQGRAHVASAQVVVDADPAGAFALVCDSARKVLTAVLVNQGLRTGGDGAHALLLDVVRAQLDPPLGSIFRSFSWMRPLRNHTQYPTPEHPVAQPEDVAESLPATIAMIDTAVRVLDRMPTY